MPSLTKSSIPRERGILVNASRAIIYASENEDFATEAKAIAKQYQFEMKGYLG